MKTLLDDGKDASIYEMLSQLANKPVRLVLANGRTPEGDLVGVNKSANTITMTATSYSDCYLECHYRLTEVVGFEITRKDDGSILHDKGGD